MPGMTAAPAIWLSAARASAAPGPRSRRASQGWDGRIILAGAEPSPA